MGIKISRTRRDTTQLGVFLAWCFSVLIVRGPKSVLGLRLLSFLLVGKAHRRFVALVETLSIILGTNSATSSSSWGWYNLEYLLFPWKFHTVPEPIELLDVVARPPARPRQPHLHELEAVDLSIFNAGSGSPYRQPLILPSSP